MSAFVDLVLDLAAGEVGVRETAPNRGQRVDEYHRYAGRDPALADSWCLQLVFWVFGRAAERLALTNPLPHTSSGHRLWERAPKEWRITGDPQPGDIGIADHGQGKSHVWIWMSAPGPDGRCQTVDGNSGVTGGRNGTMVCRHAKHPSEATLGTLRPIVG